MQIDRSNYEIWFTDWLDGNLNNIQVEQLEQFLDQNPDLRGELDDLAPLKLQISTVSFRQKDDLKKTPSDISEDQFEYLCAAYLEHDLSVSQKTELEDIIKIYPDRKRSFDLMQKTILTPPIINFSQKKRLMRRTPHQKIIRISALSISAAAAISLIIILYSVLPGTTSLNQINTAYNIRSDSTVQKPSGIMSKEINIAEIVPVHAEEKRDKMTDPVHRGGNAISGYDTLNSPSVDSPARKIDNPRITLNKIPVNPKFDLKKETFHNRLISSNQPIDIPDPADERSQIGKFISKTFREKLLKEKTPPDTPIKGFEIAEAGIAGLNKLFGWQMALDMKNDDNGQPKSVYFNSKILKVNAPVKKREPQQ
jgi:hypothetical protein